VARGGRTRSAARQDRALWRDGHMNLGVESSYGRIRRERDRRSSNEQFGHEMTMAEVRCSNCQSTSLMAELRVYMKAPRAARCPACDDVLMVIVNVRRAVRLDMSNMEMMSPRLTQPFAPRRNRRCARRRSGARARRCRGAPAPPALDDAGGRLAHRRPQLDGTTWWAVPSMRRRSGRCRS
jgi:ribosomal protein S27E